MPFNIKRVARAVLKSPALQKLRDDTPAVLPRAILYTERILSLRFQESMRGWHFSGFTCLHTSRRGASFPAVETTVVAAMVMRVRG